MGISCFKYIAKRHPLSIDGLVGYMGRKTIMSLETTDIIIARVYLTEASHELDPILAYLKDEAKIHGFSVFRAIRGFGETGLHTSRLIDISLNLPLIIEFFDEPETMHHIIQHLTAFVRAKHIVFWSAQTNRMGI
jgi:uncharacterized protein